LFPVSLKNVTLLTGLGEIFLKEPMKKNLPIESWAILE